MKLYKSTNEKPSGVSLSNVLINRNISKSRNFVVIDGNDSVSGNNFRSFSQNNIKLNFNKNLQLSATKSHAGSTMTNSHFNTSLPKVNTTHSVQFNKSNCKFSPVKMNNTSPYLKKLQRKSQLQRERIKDIKIEELIEGIFDKHDNKIRSYYFNKLDNDSNLNKPSYPGFLPKNMPKPMIKQKFVSDSEKLFPYKYVKEKIKHDEFSKIFLSKRGFVGKIITSNITTPIEKSPQKIKKKVKLLDDLEDNSLTGLHEQLNTTQSNKESPRKSIKIPKILSNSPGNIKYKDYVNYTKQTNEKMVK